MRAGIRHARLRLAVKQHRNRAESSVSSNAFRAVGPDANDSDRIERIRIDVVAFEEFGHPLLTDFTALRPGELSVNR